MTFDADIEISMLIEDSHQFVEFFSSRRQQFGATGGKLNTLRIEVVLFQFGTSVILRQTFFVGAPIFLVYDTIAICINERTAIIAGGTGFSGAFIFLIIDTIFIRIGNRTTLVAGQACYCGAFIFFIIDTILICIWDGATLVFGQTWYSRTFIEAINNSILIGINRRSRSRRQGFQRSGLFFLPIRPAIPN